MISDERLLPRDQLDEFGLILDFIDYMSDTFPVQTNAKKLDENVLVFDLANYNDVVQAIVEAKLGKLVTADHRIVCRISIGGNGVATVSLYFPSKEYRTKRALPVYTNLERIGPGVGVICAPEHNIFADIKRMSRPIKLALNTVQAYQAKVVDYSRDKLFKGLKTGTKQCDRRS